MHLHMAEYAKMFTKDNNNTKVKYILNEHGELIAALTSGLLMLIGWLLTYENTIFSIVFFIIAFVIGGYAKAKEGITETIEKKTLNVELLMFLAAIGSALIGYWWEGGVLIFIFALSGALETYTTNKSRKEISSLMNIQPEKATRIEDGEERVIHAKELAVGDRIIVKPGERIPADGVILKGETTVDESAITGESLPVMKCKNDEVFAGTINVNGVLIVEVAKKANDTLFQKIIDLVQNAQSEKSPSQLFIEKFEDVYVKVVLFAVLLMMVIPHFAFGWSFADTLYRAMVLLVVASPCAVVASIMPATLAAISNGAKRGVLFKGGVHLEQLGHIKAVAFDKTGTLTLGQPSVTDVVPFGDRNEHDLLRLAAAIEHHSNHPLAQAIVHEYKKLSQVPLPEVGDMEETAGLGVEATVDGQRWRIGQAGWFLDDEPAEAQSLKEEGKTVVYVGNEAGIQGLIAMKDKVRPEASSAIKTLKSLGIHTIMLTGDHETTARAVAKEAGVDVYVAKCLPEEKLAYIKNIKESYGRTAMVGDGMNDAPALATADVGIAMGEGTDVALETADVVLMKNSLDKIAYAIQLSRRMNRVVKQNITFAVAVIFLLICSNFLQAINLPFGVVGHEGSTILVILNGLRLLRPVAGEKGRTETPSSKWRLTEGLNRQASVSKN